MDRLADALNGAQFAADEIVKFVHSPRPAAKANEHVDFLLGAIDLFRRGLAERGLSDFYERDLILLEYPLSALKKYFGAASGVTPTGALDDPTAAYIFARFVNDQLQAFLHFAQEIDADSAA